MALEFKECVCVCFVGEFHWMHLVKHRQEGAQLTKTIILNCLKCSTEAKNRCRTMFLVYSYTTGLGGTLYCKDGFYHV